jgi:hypothetical protein
MSSDQVINQIIRSIVTISTEAIKRDEPEPSKPAEDNQVVFVSESEQSKITVVSDLFVHGFHSKVQNFQITDTLAAFMIRAVVLDPQYGFRVEKEMSRDEVNRLIDICVQKITATDDFEMETIRMQVYFDTNFPSQGDFLHQEKMARLEQCAALLRDIIQAKSKAIPSLEGNRNS